jgi:tRNA(Arg) A34 adenosine deaminase TadA
MPTPAINLTTTMMQAVIAAGQHVGRKGEIPVRAVIFKSDGILLATADNEVEIRKNATAHAEVLCITQALQKTCSKYLDDRHIAVTLEPCATCAMALSHVRISSVVFGAYDLKSGGTVSNARVIQHAHHSPRSSALLRSRPVVI